MRQPSEKIVFEEPDLSKRRDNIHKWEFNISAVTPIYKGGANSKGIDVGIPFRGASFKGLLRIWWRATQETTDVHKLREREGEIFGQAFGDSVRASKVSVGVTKMNSNTSTKPDLDWVTWVERDNANRSFHDKAKGTLTVKSEGYKEEVEVALKAMLLFGGYGSRSRRGLGALWTDDNEIIPEFKNVDEFKKYALTLCPTAKKRNWPSLGGATLAVSTFNGADAFSVLQKAIRDFKSIRGMKSTGGKNFSGADRAKIYQDEWLAVRNMVENHGTGPKGYTAALGMPLEYRSSNNHLNGPVKIVPEGKDARLPSPVLVKPVKINGKWHAIFLILPLWVFPKMTCTQGRLNRIPEDALSPFIEAISKKQYTTFSLGRG